VKFDDAGVQYTNTALVTDLRSGDGPHVKPGDETTVRSVPLETDYSNGLVTGFDLMTTITDLMDP